MEDLVLGLQQYRVVSKDKWRDISTFIGEHDWVSLAGVLGFNSEEINTIKADTPGNWRALCYSMLDKWHHRQDKNEDQCIKKLCAALTDIGRKGLAILLQQHFQGIGQAKKCNPKTAVTIDECLNNVARDIGRSDWEKLAFHLGLSGEDVALIRELHCHEWQDPNLYSIRPWLHRPPYAWEDEWLDFRHPKFQYPCLHMLHIWKHRQVVSEDEILAKLCDALSRMGRDNLAHQWRHRHVEIPEDQLQERLDTDAMAQEPKSEHPEDSIMRLCVGAFGTVGSQSSSAAVEILGCLDTDEAKEKMFKYCQEKCLRMFDFTEKEIKMDSQEDCDLQVIVQNVGDGWMLQNCAPQHMQTMSTAELREGLFEKGQLQFAKKSDSKGDMAPARDVLSCEIIIKSLDRSMESAEDNKLQLSVNLKPAYGSNPEAVKVPLEDTPSQPTDLESALLTYQELAKEFGEEYMKENTFQLPYFAIGQFNENGGRLSLDSYSVQLYIPHGALPTGSKQQVYIYVNPNGSCDEGSDSEDSISPVVQCGPPGLKFLESVVLTLPINDVEDFKTKPSAQICEEKKDATPGDWQSLEGAFVASVENKATLLVDHFSKYRVVAGSPGYTSKKIYIGASSDYYESNGCCNVQVCLFNRKPRDSDVFFFEKKPTEAGLVLIQGDVHVRVKEVSDGYEFQPTDPKVFGRSQVWKLYKNSATVYLIRKISGYGVPTCVVNCSQKNNNENAPWKGFDVDLWVKPYPEPVSSKADKSVQHVPHLKRTLSAKVIDSVQQEPSLKEKMKSSVAKTVQGDNGGLSKTAFDELCSLLEAPQEGDSHWIRFTLSFFGTSTSLVEKAKRNPSPARVVLNAYFALKTKEEDAVTSLVRDFERLGFGDEVREVTQRGSTVPGNNNRYCQRDLQGRIPHASSCGGTKTSHTILMTSQCVQDEAGSAQHTVDQGTSNGISTQDMEVDYTDQEIILDHFKNLSLQ